MHPALERLRPYAGAIAVAAAIATWALVFREGASDKQWNDNEVLGSSIQTRGKEVALRNSEVETTAEREKRLTKRFKSLRDMKNDLKKEVMGEGKATRGDRVMEDPGEAIPDHFKVPPREACLQLKLEYPDRFGKLDCMAEKYDSPDPWWNTPQTHDPADQ